MRRKKIWLNIIGVTIILVCLGCMGLAIKADESIELMIAIVSLGVALIALYISLRTFYSIDEVNAISRMDGNVMENPRYRPNILRAVFLFPQTGFKETSEVLMSHMENLFSEKNKQSGAHLADNVQEVADLLVLIPYFIKTNYQEASAIQLERVSTLLDTIRYKVENFKEISDGSCKLLEETVDLIDSVFAYQKMTAKKKSDPSKLLEIRGSLFVNPVTCILYYDYLGLYFMRRARGVILKHHEDVSLRELIECAKECKGEEGSLATVYLEKAISAFKRAKENIGDDMIWTGYICFNIARADYLTQVINETIAGSTNSEWETYINESIRSWMTVNRIIDEHFNKRELAGKHTWLQQAFISEENNVRLSKVVMQMMIQQPLTDYNSNAWISDYSAITESSFFNSVPPQDPLKLSDTLMNDIRNLLSEYNQN